jgi:hypothetical protein
MANHAKKCYVNEVFCLRGWVVPLVSWFWRGEWCFLCVQDGDCKAMEIRDTLIMIQESNIACLLFTPVL